MYYSSYHFYFYEVRLGVCSTNSKYTSVVGSPRTQHVTRQSPRRVAPRRALRSLFFSRASCCFFLKTFLIYKNTLSSFVFPVICCLQKWKKRKKKGKKKKKNTSSHTTQNRTEVSRFSLVIVSLCSTRRRTCRDTNRTEHPQHKQIRSTATRAQRCKR